MSSRGLGSTYTKYLSFGLGFLIQALSTNLFAQSAGVVAALKSEFEIQLTPQRVSEELNKYIEIISVKGQDFYIQEPFTARLSKFSAAGQVRVLNSKLNDGSGLSALVAIDNLVLRLPKFDFVYVVEIAVGDGRPPIKSTISGSCNDLLVGFKNPISSDFSGQLLPQGNVLVQSLNWNADQVPYDWSVSKCEGPGGLSEFIKENVFPQLLRSSWAKDFIREQIAGKLTRQVGVIKRFTQEFSGNQLIINPGYISWDSKAVKVSGISEFVPRVPCPIIQSELKQQPIPLDKNNGITKISSAASKNESIVLPEAFAFKIIQCFHELGYYEQKLSTAKITAFRDLQKSTFQQYFVWPDLGSYSSEQEFLMTNKTYESWNLINKTEQVSSRPKEVVMMAALTTTLASSWRFYNDGKEGSPYVTFWTPLSAEISATMLSDRLQFKVVEVQAPKISYRFDKTVSNNLIDTKQFEPHVKDVLASTQFEFPLPKLNLGLNNVLRINSLETTGSGKNWVFSITTK